MTRHRPGSYLALSLMAAAGLLAGAILALRPEQVHAAPPKPNRFTFSPVFVQHGQDLNFAFFNAAANATPGATLHLLDVTTGGEFAHHQIPSLAAGTGDLFTFSPSSPVQVV